MVKKMQAKQRRERAGAKMALPSPLTSRVITSRRFRRLVFVIFLFTMAAMQACAVCGCGTASGGIPAEAAGFELLGEKAAKEALRMLSIPVAPVAPGRLIVLSNAGYAEVGGQSAFGAQDGLARITGGRRGDHTLLEVHSAPDAALWFAVYDRESGACAYLETDPALGFSRRFIAGHSAEELFHIRSVENVKADYLFTHSAEFDAKMKPRPFGNNAFRIISMVNAVDAGAPTMVVKSFEFHDHYCPGVTSGILMADYIKKHLPLSPGGSYFVHSVQPWCKDDAFLVMLNTTPGKGGYAVFHPTDQDRAAWPEALQDAATIFYRRNPETDVWDGLVLGFRWGETDCPDFGKSMVGKLCGDLYYLKHLSAPEKFVAVLHAFQLPKGVHPKTYARPGVNPLLEPGLAPARTGK